MHPVHSMSLRARRARAVFTPTRAAIALIAGTLVSSASANTLIQDQPEAGFGGEQFNINSPDVPPAISAVLSQVEITATSVGSLSTISVSTSTDITATGSQTVVIDLDGNGSMDIEVGYQDGTIFTQTRDSPTGFNAGIYSDGLGWAGQNLGSLTAGSVQFSDGGFDANGFVLTTTDLGPDARIAGFGIYSDQGVEGVFIIDGSPVNFSGEGEAVIFADEFVTLNAPAIEFTQFATLTLEAQNACLNASGNQLVVEIRLSDAPQVVEGGQFAIEYDPSVLSFVSAQPGDAPFTFEVFEQSNGPGELLYATGVPFTSSGTDADTVMARLTFDVLVEVCAAADLVTFDTTPFLLPTRLTDADGDEVPAVLTDLGTIRNDNTPPSLTDPADLILNADAGQCTASLATQFTETLDSPIVLADPPIPGAWEVDRFAPAFFGNEFFDGDNRLRLGLLGADQQANQFQNTQGRKTQVDIPAGFTFSADVYIDDQFATNVRRTDLWGEGRNGQNSIASFPIIGFASSDPIDSLNPLAAPVPRFRIFSQDADQDPTNGFSAGWIDLGLPPGFAFNEWYTLKITITGSTFEYEVVNEAGSTILSFSDTATNGTVRVRKLFIQGFNFGEDYDVYWDNVVLGPEGPIVTDNCSGVSLVGTRDDGLGLNDPFPIGTTTITWTATDPCGNSAEVEQDVTVSANNTLNVAVELAGSIAPGPFTRCITFELTPTSGGMPVVVEADLEFTNGLAIASIDIPCGDYNCITARDTKHTLARTDLNFGISGASYVADFTSSSSMGDNSLIGGNLNDDAFIRYPRLRHLHLPLRRHAGCRLALRAVRLPCRHQR